MSKKNALRALKQTRREAVQGCYLASIQAYMAQDTLEQRIAIKRRTLASRP